jgi:hypothetical protein
MNSEFYMMLMICVLVTACTVFVVLWVVWFAYTIYDDIVGKRKWRKRLD